jgi:hypothetical protein
MRFHWRHVGVAIGIAAVLYLLVAWYYDAGAVFRALLPARWRREGFNPEDVSILVVLLLLVVLGAAWNSRSSR